MRKTYNIVSTKLSRKNCDFLLNWIERNFNKIARSYKMIAEEAKRVVGFEFVWFTDEMGWYQARNNLRERFDNMEHIYNIADMKNGIMKEIFK